MAVKKVSPGQQFEIGGEKFRVARVAGKEARLVKVGVKSESASEAGGTLKYRRLTTLERMLAADKPNPQARTAADPVADESMIHHNSSEAEVVAS